MTNKKGRVINPNSSFVGDVQIIAVAAVPVAQFGKACWPVANAVSYVCCDTPVIACWLGLSGGGSRVAISAVEVACFVMADVVALFVAPEGGGAARGAFSTVIVVELTC